MKGLLSNRKIIITVIIIFLSLIIGLGSFIYQKKEAEGFCWAAGKRLSDDELYKEAILNLIEFHQEWQEEQHTKWRYACSHTANCKIWMIKESMSIPRFKEKMELSWNKKMLDIIKIVDMQELESKVFFKSLKQNNNDFALFHNLGGSGYFYPYNCCEIISMKKIKKLKKEFEKNKQLLRFKSNLAHVEPENQPLERRYLRFNEFRTGIHDSRSNFRDGLKGVFDFESMKNYTGISDRYFPLSNCGKILSN